MKAYIITSPCAGKTSVANRSPNYCGIRILDHNNLMATMFDLGTISVKSSELEKAAVLLSYLESLKFPACILGSYMPDDPANYPNIRFIGVVLPKPIHYLYTTKRRIRSTLARAHDGVPVLKSLEPTDRWDLWANTAKHRKKVISYIAKHELPLFASLQDALDSLKLHQTDNQESNRRAT